MTHFDEIKNMSIDELAEYFADTKSFPYAPCYICQYDEGLLCGSPVICTKEYKASLYKKWLEEEVCMRVYERKIKWDFEYPEQMEMILDYLNKHGEILTSELTIESLYRDFSDEKYCASWMGVNAQILEEFEDWLEHYDRPRYY